MSLTVTQNDFGNLDLSQRLNVSIANDPNFTAISGTNIAYKAVAHEAPGGTWVVGNEKATAAGVVLAKFYQGFLSANSTIGTHLSAMNINTQFANASAQFSAKLKADVANMGVGATKTYNDLVTAAGAFVGGLNMSAADFVKQVLPNETASKTYSSTEYAALTTTVDQYTNAKLTDNSVLQQKLDTANANRSAILDAMSGILKTWGDFLNTLAKGL